MNNPGPVPRSRNLVVAAVALAMVAAGLVVALWLAPRSDGKPVAVAGPNVCAIQVVIDFDTDAEMRAAAASLGRDGRVAALATITQQQAYDKFRIEFQNMPDLASLGRPEALPGSVWIAPTRGTDPEILAAELRGRFPSAQDVRVVPCTKPAGSPTMTS